MTFTSFNISREYQRSAGVSSRFLALALVAALGAGVRAEEASSAPTPGGAGLTGVNWKGLAAEGVKALPRIQPYLEQVDWAKYAEDFDDVPGAQDMVLALVAILRQAPQAIPVFGDLLRTGSSKTRWGIFSAIQLTPIRDARFLPGLDLAVRDPSREVRYRAVFLLSEIPDPKAIPIARRVLEMERDHLIRIRAAEGLGRLRQPEGARILLDYLKHPDVWVREAAALALGNVRGKTAQDGLVAALRTEKTNIVQGAILDSLRAHTGRDWFDLRDQYLGPGWRPDRPAQGKKKKS